LNRVSFAVVLLLERLAPGLGVDAHRAELQHGEGPAALADPPLAVERGAGGVDPDQEGEAQEQRC
jgi:hypothetical protein